MEKDVAMDGVPGRKYRCHEPCHTPLKTHGAQNILNNLLPGKSAPIPDGDLAPWNAPDGQINTADVMIAMQLAAGLRTPGDLQYAHGDMNLDDTIDLADVLLIQQTVAP